jgi:hypothetical protein
MDYCASPVANRCHHRWHHPAGKSRLTESQTVEYGSEGETNVSKCCGSHRVGQRTNATGVERMKTQETYVSTFDAISSLVARFGSQRAAAKILGVPPATISDILGNRTEHLSRERENLLRLTLGLPILPPKIAIDPCPDCSGIHTGRCHNKNVILRPVIKRREPSRWRDLPLERLAAAIKYREPV